MPSDKLARAKTLLIKAGFVEDVFTATWFRLIVDKYKFKNYDFVTDEDLYADPVSALSKVRIGFVWGADEATEVITKKDLKDMGFTELFGDSEMLPNNSITKCQHKWVQYTGLQEIDTFCEKCKEKQ